MYHVDLKHQIIYINNTQGHFHMMDPMHKPYMPVLYSKMQADMSENTIEKYNTSHAIYRFESDIVKDEVIHYVVLGFLGPQLGPQIR